MLVLSFAPKSQLMARDHLAAAQCLHYQFMIDICKITLDDNNFMMINCLLATYLPLNLRSVNISFILHFYFQ